MHALLQFPFHVGVEVVTLKTRVQDNAFLVGIVGRESIAVLLRTTIDTQFMTLLDSRTQHRILPVGTLTEGCNLSIRITSLITKIVLLILCPLRGGEQVELLGHAAHAQRIVVVHVRLTLAQLTFLGGDENHAVSTARAVDGSGRHILQDFDTLDVIGVDGGQGVQTALDSTDTRGVVGRILEIDKAIDHIERFVGRIHRVAATNTDMTVGTWLATAGRHRQTSHLSAQRHIERGGCGLLEDVGLDGGHATRQLVALLRTVTHHDDLVQLIRIINERYLHGLLEVVHIHIQRTVAHILYP